MEKSYNPQEIAKSVRQCGEMGCDTCLVTDDRSECVKMQLKAAADTIENLAEENRRLLDATEGLVKELTERMVNLARESNTARERGLQKASGDYVLALNEIQVEGREVFNGEEAVQDG